MSYSNFVIFIPQKTLIARRASDGHNLLDGSQNPLAPGYGTQLSLYAGLPSKLLPSTEHAIPFASFLKIYRKLLLFCLVA